MEAYSSSYSTSNSSYLSQNPEEAKGLKKAYSFQSHSLLHSVRKSQSKPLKKAPVAPPPPTRIKVYEVDVTNFRELVQQLTGAPEFKPQLQDHHHHHHQFVQNVPTATITPQNTVLSSRDISIAATPSAVSSTNWYQGAQSQETSGREKLQGLLELNLSSPSSYSWCSFPPSSRGQ